MARYDFIKDLVKGRKVLDAGCGFGYGADYLSGWAKEVVGVDSNNEAIEWARSHYRRGNVSFVLSDLKELKIPAGYFDAVCLFEAIHQVKDHEILLKELWRVLKEGGLLIISTRRRRPETVTPHPLHVHEFKASELEALLKKSGFSDVRLYGMERPAEAYKLEAELEKVRRLDPMGIKKIIPRKAVSALVYLISKAKGITPPQELDYGSFGISKETIDTAPGILAVSAKSSAAQVKESGRP
jgi:SAM-dependent methyltransferase